MKLWIYSLNGQSIRKSFGEEYFIRSKKRLIKQNDGQYVDYEALPIGEIVFKYKRDPGSFKIKEVEKRMHSLLGIFVLSHSKRIMNKTFHPTHGFYSNKFYDQHTDSLYIQMNFYQRLKNAGFVGTVLGQGKNNYGYGGFISSSF